MIVVPSGNALVGIADRAGYPVLTVPAGYGTGGAGRNPIGVTFVGTAFSEAKLLAAGYAFEQATNVRLAPSFTNPSMWRCVTGSTFFTGELCHPGDRLADRLTGSAESAALRVTAAARDAVALRRFGDGCGDHADDLAVEDARDDVLRPELVGADRRPAIASPAASFIPSVMSRARTSSAPRKMPGKASTLLIWFG